MNSTSTPIFMQLGDGRVENRKKFGSFAME